MGSNGGKQAYELHNLNTCFRLSESLPKGNMLLEYGIRVVRSSSLGLW